MRIGILAPPWLAVPPPAYGGTETVLDSLARGLVTAGAEVSLFATGDSTCPVPTLWEYKHGVGVGAPGAAAELRQAIAGYEALSEVDVVHDHTLVGIVYGQLKSKAPIVTTNHGPFLSDLGPLYRSVCDEVAVLAISHHQASTAAGIRLAGIIHHGVDPERFPLGSGGGGYAAFLGRMTPEKGVDVAARTARAAGIPLRIAAKMSESHEREYFDAHVRPLLSADIEYVGEVAGMDKAEFLGEAVALLNPIRWAEPFGMVMIEAGACGTPVVVSRRGSAPEIVTDGVSGFLCDNETDLVNALDSAPTLNRRVCRDEILRRFSTRQMVDAHLSLYRQLMGAADSVHVEKGRGDRQWGSQIAAGSLTHAGLGARPSRLSRTEGEGIRA